MTRQDRKISLARYILESWIAEVNSAKFLLCFNFELQKWISWNLLFMRSQFANLSPGQISSHANFLPPDTYFKSDQCKKSMNQVLSCLTRNFSALHVFKVLYVNTNTLSLFACSIMVESFLFGFSRFISTPLIIFICYSSSDCVTIKIPHRVDEALLPIFSYWFG